MWVTIIISFCGYLWEKPLEVPVLKTFLLFVFSKMAVRTHDGKKVKKVWERRRLEEWKDDIRWNTEDKPELVLHPIVDPPPKHEKEGLSYSKAWQAQFWEDYGRVAGEDVTLEECGRKEAIICRNVGGRQSSDFFRVYSLKRWSLTDKRRKSTDGWVELSAFAKISTTMPADWYDSVLKKGYVKILDAAEINICEHNMELDLRIAAAQSYENFKKRYKRKYGTAAAARPKATKATAVNVEVDAEAPAAEEEVPPPSRKRKQRSDAEQPRYNVSKLRVHTTSSCIKTRQIRINGKWHDLVEV